MKTFKVGIVIGSLRREAYSRKMALALSSLAPQNLHTEEIDIGSLEMYNPDLEDEGSPTAAWTKFREKIKGCDAVLFITPEHNRSMPAALKNALDVGSRPYGESVWNGKPGAVVSLSPGALGGFGANHHLRQSLVFLNVPAMAQPEAYIGNVEALFDASGALKNERTEKYLRGFMDAFLQWIRGNSPDREEQ